MALLNRFTQVGRPTTVAVHAMAQLGLGLGSCRLCAIGLDPVAKSPEHGVPLAELHRKVSPRAANAHDPKHSLDKEPVVYATATSVSNLT